jgi:hypothetical protein
MKPLHPEYKFLFAAAASIVLLAISSCKDSSNPITKLDEIVFPDTGISYERQVQPLFNVGCAFAGCHDNANNLDLTRYLAWYKNPLVIIPGDTSKSTLVWSIEAQPGSPAMPPAKPLSRNQITGLKRWILEGAKDTQ